MERVSQLAILCSTILGVALCACSTSPGKQAFTMCGCLTCHGPDREGTRIGPPLKDLGYNWTAGTLDAYLRNPEPFLEKDQRLKNLKKMHGASMPPAPITEASRGELITYLLAE